jgi:3-oxoacyl-[acyl-carrier-protein] synthase-3
MQAAIRAIEYYLPEKVLSTADLSAAFPEWSVEKIDRATGVEKRHIAAPDECSSDLAVKAARTLLDSGVCEAADIDYLLLCTQSPDYFLPTTACLLQDRLGLSTNMGAIDFNQGCSGYLYGLGLAQGLIASGQASNVLLITAETYSKFIHNADKSVRTIFGDAAAATLVTSTASEQPLIGPFIYGTDGRGEPHLIVKTGGFRAARTPASGEAFEDGSGNIRSDDNLFMDGAEIFTMALSAVPKSVQALLDKSQRSMDEVDLVVFHQSNKYLLDHLRKKIKVPAEKFYIDLRDCGNTVSSTIPIALKRAAQAGRMKDGALVMLVGFGVGYSWAATLVRWSGFKAGN